MASKIAVVTGANQGIGYEIVRLLKPALAAGSRVVLCSRDRTRGQQAVESLRDKGVEADLGILEITDKNSIESFAQWLRDTYGRVDILINNAGFAFKVRECHLGSEGDMCTDRHVYDRALPPSHSTCKRARRPTSTTTERSTSPRPCCR